ncbi:MAG: HlyD family efflux transporter periplasmic adaptor subunit [Microbacterium sp.]
MTWPNRFRLLVGMIAIIAVAAAGTLVFNQRQLKAESLTASIIAEQYSVGTTYAGVVTAQLVDVGDSVEVGEPLFQLRSAMLARDLADASVDPADLGLQLMEDGTFAVTANVSGVVSEVFSPVGDFASADAALATIDRDGTLAVSAEFSLSPRDYGRISTGSIVDVRLPDDRTIRGTVRVIDVETIAGQARSTVIVDSSALESGADEPLFAPGTPVQAAMYLRDDGPLAGVSDLVSDFVRKIGL